MSLERWAYFPAVDMLRGVAVLAVFLSHGPALIGVEESLARAIALPALGVGVDLFFVISGFVSVLAYRRAKSTAAAGFGELLFWGKRVARLMPLAWVVAACLSVGLLVQNGVTKDDLWAAATFSGNVHWARCWAGTAVDCGNSNWLGHYWSLGLEVQFYLILPALMLIPLKWFRLGVGIVCLVGVFTWRPWGGALWAFRPEAFLLGMLIAREGADSRLKELVSGLPQIGVIEAGAWLLVAAMVARIFDAIAPGFGGVLAAVICAYMVLRAVVHDDPLTRLGEGMRWIGVRSFGAYLVHPAMLAIAGWGLAQSYGFAAALAAGAVATALAAHWLYREIEQPARRRLGAICECGLMARPKERRDELEAAR